MTLARFAKALGMAGPVLLLFATILLSDRADAAFNNASLNGTCGFGLESVSSGGKTSGGIGLFTFDGSGNLSGKVAAADNSGEVFTDFTTFSGGTYSVNSDGTGTASFSGNGTSVSLSFVIDNRGNEVRGILGNTGKAGFFRCEMQSALAVATEGDSNLNGKYGFLFVEDGTQSAGQLSGTSAAIGVVSLDGSGHLNGNVAVSTAGDSAVAPFTSFTGTYTFNVNTLTGSLAFTVNGIQFTMPFAVGRRFTEIRAINSATNVAGIFEARLQ